MNETQNSERFQIRCGVKQGGIIYPLLFNVYINDLIEECLSKNIGALYNKYNVCIGVRAGRPALNQEPVLVKFR